LGKFTFAVNLKRWEGSLHPFDLIKHICKGILWLLLLSMASRIFLHLHGTFSSNIKAPPFALFSLAHFFYLSFHNQFVYLLLVSQAHNNVFLGFPKFLLLLVFLQVMLFLNKLFFELTRVHLWSFSRRKQWYHRSFC